MVISVGTAELASPIIACATTIDDVQNQINQHQQEINKILDQIADLEDEQDLIEEEIADLNAEIINTMASIELKEEEIAAKEEQILEKSDQIDIAVQNYDAAVAKVEEQRVRMAEYTRMMYENKDVTYLSSFLMGKGFSDILNQMDYVERVYEYSMFKLEAYKESQQNLKEMWDCLVEQKVGLEEDRVSLEADKAELADMKADLDTKLAKKKQESSNYDAEIRKAKNEANQVKLQLKRDKEQLKKLQDALKKQNAGANITVTNTNYAAITDAATGSDLGKKIAKYGCQYIGNPYVAGGTSLTNGADCSGFTYRIYSDFGYSIPRTSYQQRSAGTGVAYENAQPGDLICYDGHVAMYIGGGLIVHASNKKTGIKVSKATYRTILAVRRII